MDLPELPKRIFTLEEKPFPFKSIVYHTYDSKLLSAVRAALYDDEYEELKDSRLGVYIKFKEFNFGWSLHMLCFQLNIKKKFEHWSLVGPERGEFTKEMVSFWEMMAVDVDGGPSSEHIISMCERCEECDDGLFKGKRFEKVLYYWWVYTSSPGVDLLCAARFGYYLWKTHTKQTDSTFSGLQQWKKDVDTEESPMKKETAVKEESGRAQKKARKEASTVRSSFLGIGWKLCRKVGIIKKGNASNDLQHTTSDQPKHGHELGLVPKSLLKSL
ncbi:hypothetical protein Bca101_097074 [Brassica carinata]